MKQVAIVVRRTYNTVKFPDDYIVGTPKNIDKTIQSVKADPDLYCRHQAFKDHLSAAPSITIQDATGYLPNTETQIKAIVHFVYETPQWLTDKQKRPSLAKLFLIVLILIAISGIYTTVNLYEKHFVETVCKVFTENGIPTSVKFDGKWSYPLNPDGSFNMPKGFVNPWHQEIDLSKCILINTK